MQWPIVLMPLPNLDVGHYNPDYSGNNQKLSLAPKTSDLAGVVFPEFTQLFTFDHFIENIPQTTVSISMKAIPGGTFNMGSPSDEPFRRDDEGPVREVTISPFYMSETEVILGAIPGILQRNHV